AQNLIGKLIEADSSIGYILFIIGALGDPDISNGLRHGGIGAGTRGNPFVAQDGGGVIEIRIDMDLFDAQFFEPQAPDSGVLTAVIGPGGIRVVAPVNDHFAVL